MFYLVFYQKILRVDVCIIDRSYLEECLGGVQISLVEVCRFGERLICWYNFFSYKYLKKQSREFKLVGVIVFVLGFVSMDVVFVLLEQIVVELEKRQEGRSSIQILEDSWRYEEISENEVVVEEEEEEVEEEEEEEDVFIEKVLFDMDGYLVLKVDKEINMEILVLFFIVV